MHNPVLWIFKLFEFVTLFFTNRTW